MNIRFHTTIELKKKNEKYNTVLIGIIIAYCVIDNIQLC